MDVEKAKGIRVSEWLVALKTDVVLLRQDVHGKGRLTYSLTLAWRSG